MKESKLLKIRQIDRQNFVKNGGPELEKRSKTVNVLKRIKTLYQDLPLKKAQSKFMKVKKRRKHTASVSGKVTTLRGPGRSTWPDRQLPGRVWFATSPLATDTSSMADQYPRPQSSRLKTEQAAQAGAESDSQGSDSAELPPQETASPVVQWEWAPVATLTLLERQADGNSEENVRRRQEKRKRIEEEIRDIENKSLEPTIKIRILENGAGGTVKKSENGKVEEVAASKMAADITGGGTSQMSGSLDREKREPEVGPSNNKDPEGIENEEDCDDKYCAQGKKKEKEKTVNNTMTERDEHIKGEKEKGNRKKDWMDGLDDDDWMDGNDSKESVPDESDKLEDEINIDEIDDENIGKQNKSKP